MPVAVPYATLANPQTLNLYSIVGDDPETSVDLDGHCDANDWCGTLVGIAGGLNNAVNHAYDGIVATLKDPLTPVSAAVQFADNGLMAYETKGVSLASSATLQHRGEKAPLRSLRRQCSRVVSRPLLIQGKLPRPQQKEGSQAKPEC